jgi:hypothetical protein
MQTAVKNDAKCSIEPWEALKMKSSLEMDCLAQDTPAAVPVTSPEPDPEARQTADCTEFLGLDPEKLRVRCLPGRIEIEAGEYDAREENMQLIQDLFAVLDESPPDSDWQLDLARSARVNLHLLDGLLSIGRQLRMRGGGLELSGLRLEAAPAPFRDLFLARCRELGIHIGGLEE